MTMLVNKRTNKSNALLQNPPTHQKFHNIAEFKNFFSRAHAYARVYCASILGDLLLLLRQKMEKQMNEFNICSALKFEIDFIKDTGYDTNFAEFMQKIGEFIAIPYEYEVGDEYEERGSIFINVVISINQSGESQDVLSKINALFHEIISIGTQFHIYVMSCRINNFLSTP